MYYVVKTYRWKKELWSGANESVWGKLVNHSCYLKLEMTVFLTIKNPLYKKSHNSTKSNQFSKNKKFQKAY